MKYTVSEAKKVRAVILFGGILFFGCEGAYGYHTHGWWGIVREVPFIVLIVSAMVLFFWPRKVNKGE